MPKKPSSSNGAPAAPTPPVDRGNASTLPSRLISPTQLARKLGISRMSVNRWVRAGKLTPPVRYSGMTTRFDESIVAQDLARLAQADHGVADRSRTLRVAREAKFARSAALAEAFVV